MIDPYSLEGTDLMAGFQMRLDGRPRGCATSKAMELGWAKAEEAVTLNKADEAVLKSDARPVRRWRVPAGLAIAALVAGAGSYALLTYHHAESAPIAVTTSYVMPDLAKTVNDPSWGWSDLGQHLHVVLPATPIQTTASAHLPATLPSAPVSAAPSAADVLAQLRAVEAARRALQRREHRVVVAPETSDLLSRGDELLKGGNVAAARSLFGRAANGTGPDAVLAADRLNQLDAAR